MAPARGRPSTLLSRTKKLVTSSVATTVPSCDFRNQLARCSCTMNRSLRCNEREEVAALKIDGLNEAVQVVQLQRRHRRANTPREITDPGVGGSTASTNFDWRARLRRTTAHIDGLARARPATTVTTSPLLAAQQQPLESESSPSAHLGRPFAGPLEPGSTAGSKSHVAIISPIAVDRARFDVDRDEEVEPRRSARAVRVIQHQEPRAVRLAPRYLSAIPRPRLRLAVSAVGREAPRGT